MIWTVLGVIVAVVLAWFLVDGLFRLIWIIGKLLIVAVVAVLVFFALRGVLVRRDSSDSGD